MSLTPEQARIVKEREEAGIYNAPRGDDTTPYVISIAWHVLTNSDGDVAIDEVTLESMIEYANDAWAPQNISFAAHPIINYIESDSLWSGIDSYDDVDSFRSIDPLENAMNIYWAPELVGGSLCGISAFTFSDLDTIAMQTSCIGYEDVRGVFTHELGHWFDLFHTFESATGTECVNGSNCDSAGDYVCDTPASFGLEFNACVNASNCELTCTNEPGPCAGDSFYNPSTINYMSYSTPNCLSEFSQGQYSRIRSIAVNLRTSYLNTYLHEPCAADLNDDSFVNIDDLLGIISAFGDTGGNADVNFDGAVDIADILELLDRWGDCYDCTNDGNCDDGNPDTVDSCLFGECINEIPPPCPTGEVLDCNGNCAPADWIGDGYCDDGSYSHNGIPIYLNCDAFNCDDGDCNCLNN